MTGKRDDSLYVKDSTSADEILKYVRRRTTNPIRCRGHTIWNYSSYQFDEEVFEGKERSDLIMPYEVPGTWGCMYALLPDRVREAEVLIYRPDDEEYVAFKNFYRPIDGAQRDEFKKSLSKELIDQEEWYE
jgi:hypothetical protein